MKRQILAAVLGWLALALPARADISGGIDWSAWQRMPVLQDGRIMPLDSYARAQVKKICGEIRPTLGKLGLMTDAEMQALSPEERSRLAAAGRPRQFLAAELLYSWTVEPEKWDDVPFLLADDERLRREVLEVPLVGEDGSRLRYVSPRQVRSAKKLAAVMAEIETALADAQKTKHKPELSAIQEKVRSLDESLELFLQLSYDPGRPAARNPWMESDFVGMQKSWERFAQALVQHHGLTVQPENLRMVDESEQAMQLLKEKLKPCLRAERLQTELGQLAEKTDQSMQQFASVWSSIQTGQNPVQGIEPVVTELRRSTAGLDAKMRELAGTDLPDPPLLGEDDAEAIRSNRQTFLRWTKDLALQAAQLQWAFCSAGGESINIVPAMETTALEADRYRSEIHPWISLQAVLRGSAGLLHAYPAEGLQNIRAAWRDARAAYFNRQDGEEAGRFAASMQHFTAEVRRLSETIEPDRQQLPIVERDRGLLAKTAYPAAIATDAEALYNQVDPFFWSGCASLVAVCILGLSFITLRKPLFWTGASVMAGGILLIVGGFVVRMYITRWAPVTSMFETIVWVGMASALLMLWVTFLPLLAPTSKAAWGLTAIPGSWEDKRRPDPAVAGPPETSQAGIRAVALALRLALFVAGLFVALDYMGVFKPVAGGGNDWGAVLPRADLGSSVPNLSASLVWAASMFVAVMFVWNLPRIIPSGLFAIPMSLALAGRAEGAERMEKIYRSRVVALAGAVACFLAALAALYAPFPRDIQALMPVLRSNFWLGIHVLTITTSYAAVLAAWVIGNVALGYFAFGRYRTVDRRLRPKLLPASQGTTDEPGSEQPTALQVAAAILHPVEYLVLARMKEPSQTAETVPLEQAQRRPPAFCGTLAAMNYRVLQVAVLLITTGTMLGGLWADVSWGRFWGWDPKEVGALIALLLMMTALHGRRAGWHGDLSLAIGSICGFGGVIWAWYIVNFVLNAGKHAYATGEGGQVAWLVALVAAQSLFIAMAITRVMIETSKPATSESLVGDTVTLAFPESSRG